MKRMIRAHCVRMGPLLTRSGYFGIFGQIRSSRQISKIVEKANWDAAQMLEITDGDFELQRRPLSRAKNFCVTAGSIATSRGMAIDRRYDQPATKWRQLPIQTCRDL